MENRTNVGLLIGFLLMTVVAAVFGYLYYHERAITTQQEQALEVRVTDLMKAEMKLDSIAEQLDIRIAQVKQLGGSLVQLQRVKQQIETDRAELRKGNTLLTAKVKDYEAFLTTKDSEIGQLRRKNKALAGQNETLSVANTALMQERQLLADSLTEVLTKTSDLEEKVHLASGLKARNVKIVAISAKGREREGSDVKARRVDNLRVEFLLEKNPLAQSETKRIYLKILDPKGATLSDESLGSGVFSYKGADDAFTLSKDVAYTGTNQDVSILYNRTQPYQKGTYTVELYAEGQKIGEGAFSIR
ncbi:MAG: hypothetical protein KKG00_15505 [Bacteroidetes bacterium]|nr:hypothetical protein [Bacteroidota bacterium]